MVQALSLPVCGVLVSLVCYLIGITIRKRVHSPLANPLVIANVLLIAIVLFSPVGIEEYRAGGNFIIMFMAPVTVILALKIYNQRDKLKANIIPILAGCIVGSVSAVGSTWGLCKILGVNEGIAVSLLPRSVTTAIALELSEKNGGFPGITAMAVIITGIFSAFVSPIIIKTFKLKDPIAAGIAMGASGHAIGTSAALELGETEGAMSGLAIGVVGIITSVFFIFLF
ncbi:LrgB family protein [Leadbettera azotonutricia]|uniref:Murein hydrolase export regulator n=1 Tax=Leadbettera azotonutricia (strain ATCC BAA-888 / DSM 13862 / ZAS-9) TaxID=545695 RepID=F5YDD8_LEAAZ|nr:LrgB family protein [Leadbettera azotonutricia]AEF81126.1 murein hydrolase export regulator [Leadbettera azotonutricia ZAS-9]